MIRLIIYVIVGICGLFGSIDLKAQFIDRTLAATAGEYFSSSTGSISFSIGEPITETLEGADGIVLQGFQQPELKITPVGINYAEQNVQISVYPNPVQYNLTVELPEMDGATIQVWDITGKRLIFIEPASIGNSLVTVDMSGLSAGTYVLTVHNTRGEKWQYKVEKF